jgi:hypothetical protein
MFVYNLRDEYQFSCFNLIGEILQLVRMSVFFYASELDTKEQFPLQQ